MLVAQKTADLDDPKDKDIYRFGTLATVLQLLKLPDGTIKVLVEEVAQKLKGKFMEMTTQSKSKCCRRRYY